jgi:hypothetical protein
LLILTFSPPGRRVLAEAPAKSLLPTGEKVRMRGTAKRFTAHQPPRLPLW